MSGASSFVLGGGGAATIRAGIGWAQAGKLATIGFLGTGSAAGWQPWTAVFEQGYMSSDGSKGAP